MPTTFDKLNLKDHKEILVLNAPDTFEKEIRGLCDERVFRRIEEEGTRVRLVLCDSASRIPSPVEEALGES